MGRNRNLNEREHLMKTTTKFKSMRRARGFVLAVCAGIVATFMVGCAEGPYVTAYDGGSYYAPGYPYSYYDYGPTYGPRYYGSSIYRDWY
jgi:hypothetical protein